MVKRKGPDRSKLKSFTYKVFSTRNMLVLAVFAVVIIFFEYSDLTAGEALVLGAANWLIWLAFLLEFALKEYLFTGYAEAHKFEAVISIVIIVSPLISAFAALGYGPVTVIGILRAPAALNSVRLVRGIAYAAKAGHKHSKLA